MAGTESELADGDYRCASCGEVLNILGIIQHGCDVILQPSSLTRSERNTLLYVESRVVDHHGELDLEQMNWEDRQNLKVFGAAGILDVKESGNPYSHTDQVVKFTNRAWDLAGDLRQQRAIDWMERDRPDLDVDLGDVDG